MYNNCNNSISHYMMHHYFPYVQHTYILTTDMILREDEQLFFFLNTVTSFWI